MRIDHAPAGEAREAEVRQRRERRPVAGHLLERRQRRLEPCAVVRAHRRHVELAEALGRRRGLHSAERLRVLVEGHQRDDRQRRHAAHGPDCELELVQVVERLDHEQVDAASGEHGRLLGELVEPPVLRVADVTERPDRAGDEDLLARDLARVACELHACGIDRLELGLEKVARELAPVAAERVRLDQLGARADEAEMEVDDALRRAYVRLLGAAKASDGARDQGAHATVAADRRPLREPFGERVRHVGHSTFRR